MKKAKEREESGRGRKGKRDREWRRVRTNGNMAALRRCPAYETVPLPVPSLISPGAISFQRDVLSPILCTYNVQPDIAEILETEQQHPIASKLRDTSANVCKLS